jgi:hypothetical protein
MSGYYRDQATAASFQVLSNSLFTAILPFNAIYFSYRQGPEINHKKKDRLNIHRIIISNGKYKLIRPIACN